jgi:hypothetical protein
VKILFPRLLARRKAVSQKRGLALKSLCNECMRCYLVTNDSKAEVGVQFKIVHTCNVWEISFQRIGHEYNARWKILMSWGQMMTSNMNLYVVDEKRWADGMHSDQVIQFGQNASWPNALAGKHSRSFFLSSHRFLTKFLVKKQPAFKYYQLLRAAPPPQIHLFRFRIIFISLNGITHWQLDRGITRSRGGSGCL